MKITPNRMAVYLTSIAALLSALAPVVADLDLSSTVGVVGSLGAVALVVRKWLEGWQMYEQDERWAARRAEAGELS